jgi:hypothetical protein
MRSLPATVGPRQTTRGHAGPAVRPDRPDLLRRPRHRLVALAVGAERTERKGHRHLAHGDRNHSRRRRDCRRAVRATRQRDRRPGPRRLLADRAGARRRRCRVRRRGRARVPRDRRERSRGRCMVGAALPARGTLPAGQGGGRPAGGARRERARGRRRPGVRRACHRRQGSALRRSALRRSPVPRHGADAIAPGPVTGATTRR